MEASHASGFEKEAQDNGVTDTAIGEAVARGGEVAVVDGEGRPLKLDRTGFTHF
jgi:hypothetical protein